MNPHSQGEPAAQSNQLYPKCREGSSVGATIHWRHSGYNPLHSGMWNVQSTDPATHAAAVRMALCMVVIIESLLRPEEVGEALREFYQVAKGEELEACRIHRQIGGGKTLRIPCAAATTAWKWSTAWNCSTRCPPKWPRRRGRNRAMPGRATSPTMPPARWWRCAVRAGGVSRSPSSTGGSSSARYRRSTNRMKPPTGSDAMAVLRSGETAGRQQDHHLRAGGGRKAQALPGRAGCGVIRISEE